MNSKQRLQKVFYLPLEYQIFLQSTNNLSTAVFPYSFHFCKRIRYNQLGSKFISQSKEIHRDNFNVLGKDLNHNSVLSKHFLIPGRCNRSSKMSNDDVIFIGSLEQTGAGNSGRNTHESEVTITKFVTTNTNKGNLSDIMVLHSTYDSKPAEANVINQDVIFVESIDRNSTGSKRKSLPETESYQPKLPRNDDSSDTCYTQVSMDLSNESESEESTSNSGLIAETKDEIEVSSSSCSLSMRHNVETKNIQEEPSSSISVDLSFNITHNLQFDDSGSTSFTNDISSPSNSFSYADEQKLFGESGPHEVKIMSYNILAQTLLVRHINLYRHCNRNMQILQEEHRYRNIVNEILNYNCDIVCLQEVEDSDLNYFVNVLAQHNYKHVYKKRTGDNVDGCCIFYKHRKYALTRCKFVEYFKGDHHSLMNKHNVGVIANLRSAHQSIIIANTHFLYNPRRNDIRYEQCKHLLSQVKHMYETSASENTSVVITGDLNSSPKSGLVNFILRNKDFKFKSAYDLNAHSASTFHDEWTLVDYIFYTSDVLKLLAVKSLPQYNKETITRIPNKDQGSDHFALVAMFRTD